MFVYNVFCNVINLEYFGSVKITICHWNILNKFGRLLWLPYVITFFLLHSKSFLFWQKKSKVGFGSRLNTTYGRAKNIDYYLQYQLRSIDALITIFEIDVTVQFNTKIWYNLLVADSFVNYVSIVLICIL